MNNLRKLHQCYWLLLAAIGCSSSSSPAASPGPNSGGGGSGGGSGGESCSVAKLPPDNIVNSITQSFSVDSQGIVFGTLPSGSAAANATAIIGAATFGGIVTTLASIPGFPGSLISDANHVYFSFVGTQGGIYSLPRTGSGASPAPVFLETNNTRVYTFTQDANNIYASVTDRTNTPGTGSIVTIAKATNATTTVYSAPSQQTVTTLFVDGSTLWWSETASDVLTTGPTIIRSAQTGATLAPALFATIAPPVAIMQMVEFNDNVAFVYFNENPTSSGGLALSQGTYTVSRGGTPTLVDSTGAFPIAIGPGGVVYYDSFAGISKFTLGLASTPIPTTVAKVGTYGLAVDSAGTLYYATMNCIDKL